MANPPSEFGIPSTGAVLAFMVDCMGIPKKTDDYDYKELERLRKGGCGSDTYWLVARKVMDAIVASFTDARTAKETIDAVFRQKIAPPVRGIHWRTQNDLTVPFPEFAAPKEALTWKWNAAGELQNLAEHLVHDWTEFLQRHEYLVTKFGSSDRPQQNVVFHWICAFVVPFLAVNLVEYQQNDSRIETGMPRGRFWYLPMLVLPKTPGEKVSFKWPVNMVLEWWEDLLGISSLEIVAERLSRPDDEKVEAKYSELGGFEDDRRQVREWLSGNKPPKQKTINHWCGQKWDYKGIFTDDKALPLSSRWQRCRDFLRRKQLDDTTRNWLEDVRGEVKNVLQKQYRGEPLEREILPFKETPFRAFFDSDDAIADRLPVQQLIDRIAERYGPPTNEQLRTRLIIAAAFQRAFVELVELHGITNALRICDWFQQVYCFLMDLHNRTESKDEILELIRATPESQGGLRFACEWLFDEASWIELPAELTAHFLTPAE
jgi:hypothetical protein